MRLERTLKGHAKAVLTATLDVSGEYCFSGGQDRSVVLWNPHRGTLIRRFEDVHGYEVLGLAVQPSNAQFASCGGDRDVFVWDVTAGSCVRRLKAHTAVRSSCILPTEGSRESTASVMQLKAQCWSQGPMTAPCIFGTASQLRGLPFSPSQGLETAFLLCLSQNTRSWLLPSMESSDRSM
jgi:WD40 repeat protein